MIAQTIRQTPPPQHKIDTVSIQSWKFMYYWHSY